MFVFTSEDFHLRGVIHYGIHEDAVYFNQQYCDLELVNISLLLAWQTLQPFFENRERHSFCVKGEV